MEPPQATLRRAAKNIERMIAERARRLARLTPNMLRVVMLVDEQPGLWAAQLQRESGFDKKTLLYILRALSARGMIKRKTAERNDAKVLQIYLTPVGAAVAEKGRGIETDIEKAMLAEIGKGPSEFKAKLDRIAALNIEVKKPKSVLQKWPE